jgi:hypothetical protein
MARYTDPAPLLAKHMHLATAVPKKAKSIHLRRTRETTDRIVRELMSGPLKEADRRRMGFPYARRRLSRLGFQRERLKGGAVLSTKLRGLGKGSGISVPLLPINRDTGGLVASAAILRFPAVGNDQKLTLAFRASYAKYVLSEKGTKSMRARGYTTALKRINKQENKQTVYELRLMILNAAATGRV